MSNVGRYHTNINNVVDSRTQPIVPFSSSSNNNTTSFVTTPQYGRTLSLGSSYQTNSTRNNTSSNGYATPSRPIFHNRKNYRYLPYGGGSNNINDFNSHPTVDINNFQVVKDEILPVTTPQFRSIQIKDLDMFCSSSNTKRDSIEHHTFDIRDTDAWKRSMNLSDDCYEAMQNQKKELVLFKDEKKTIPTNSIIEINYANENENDEDNLDLSLHL